jgi:putative addiction module component (TIGR02574 family)
MVTSNYDSILSAAHQLPAADRVRLIDALWETVPADADMPPSDEWLEEIERRVEAIDSGHESTLPWTQIRDEALARLRRGQEH